MIFSRYKKLVQDREDIFQLMTAVKDSDQDPEIISLHLSNLICDAYHLDKQIHREISAIALKLITGSLILFTIILTLIKLL